MMEEDVCEEKTFGTLFQKHAEKIRNFLLYRGCEARQAEDIVQESFVKMWENCKKVIPEKAKSYLYTLAGNSFKNTIAHSKVQLKYQELKKREGGFVETPEFKMEETEFKEKLQNAINGLTSAQREVFLMNRIDKKKYHEIAEELDISVKAVEKRMGKALKSLRSQIIELR